MGPDLRVLGEGERRRSARGSLGALALLLVWRAAASPYLQAIRFVGVLIAVTLVAGASLYSGAMGDAMLQQRIATDPSNVNLAVSLSGQALSDARYAALDGYIRHGESADLGMSLHDLRVHHNTASLPVYRLGARGAWPLTVSLALDYYDGLTDQVTVIAGTLDPPARLPGGDMPVVISAYTARNLSDQYLYQAGATLRLHESYDRQGAPSGLRYTPDIMPLAAHLALPDVRAATPALRYESFGNVINMTDSGTAINILGIDPATAAAVMWYRLDFADQPLSRLLQTIEGTSMNAIVSASFLSATGLHQGDSFDVTLTNGARVALRVEALAHYFPSLDPSAFPFVVTSLAYLEGASGNYSPNEVWLDLPQNQGAIDRVLPLVHVWPRAVLSYEGLPPSDAAQGNPLSAGIYGVVSVGFLVAVVLVLLGFLAYTYLTLQQRIAEVAILRALGLKQGQVRSLLLFEEVFLLGAAIAGGIVAGVLTTRLFLPYLPIAANVVPPFVVVMPWSAVGEFVLAVLVVFAVVLSIHVALLLRVQLGQVLRLGDS